ncbi:Variant-specific surface protein [Giardia duodenalis]|uniref:Variant-specific surface protein n=1 Tax=Giardia intestinalis TaxID=5741 RepID=V6TZ35_GIAIN|nr:Variant-specific surface protein [Giardia intestinalis]
MKTDSSAGTSQCVIEAACKQGGTHFPTTTTNGKKICASCSDETNSGIADCQTCSKSGTAVKCSACKSGTKKPSADGTKCVDCAAAGCAKCSDEGVCLQCSADKYLTPTAQCVDSCDKLGGYYADGNVCKPCSPECASCTAAGADKCLSCPAGKALKYTDETSISGGGSCVDECKVNTGSCTDCGATIGGTKYCSRCSTSSEYPVNGVCKASTARANECTTPDNKGGCTTCASGYFLLDGGCYKTDTQVHIIK